MISNTTLLERISWISLIKRSLVILVFTLIMHQSYSQTYALPDTNLRNSLLLKHPHLMTGNQLNIFAANSYTSGLDLDSANISDASGIEYFINLRSLNLSNNNLTSIPQLSGLTSLVNLYIYNNQLTALPDISVLTSLTDIQVYNNKLTSLPSFAGLFSIMNIYCSNNLLTTLPDLSSLTNLRVLVLSSNNLGSLQDLSPLVNLRQLHVNQTGIDTIIGLSSLMNLEHLHCWENNIRDLSGLNANTKLSLLYAQDNQLQALPHFHNKPFLTFVSFKENRLTFEDILPASFHPKFYMFTYAPQKTIGTETYIRLRKNNPLELNTNIDPLVTNNWYKWYKNGLLLDSNQTGIRNIPFIGFSDAGSYAVQVRNPALPKLTLNHYPWILKVDDCEGCSAVFSPDGDGILDSYRIEETGMARIYSLSGQFIQELSIPGEWDGTQSNGSMADAGYYAIIINGKKVINISLIR